MISCIIFIGNLGLTLLIFSCSCHLLSTLFPSSFLHSLPPSPFTFFPQLNSPLTSLPFPFPSSSLLSLRITTQPFLTSQLFAGCFTNYHYACTHRGHTHTVVSHTQTNICLSTHRDSRVFVSVVCECVCMRVCCTAV